MRSAVRFRCWSFGAVASNIWSASEPATSSSASSLPIRLGGRGSILPQNKHLNSNIWIVSYSCVDRACVLTRRFTAVQLPTVLKDVASSRAQSARCERADVQMLSLIPGSVAACSFLVYKQWCPFRH
eukprot:938215-Rhodomonas_salina.1